MNTTTEPQIYERPQMIVIGSVEKFTLANSVKKNGSGADVGGKKF